MELPEGWKLVKLGEITHKITDGTHKTPKYVDKGVPFLSIKNIVNGKLDFSDVKYITEEEHKEISKRCNVEKDDILICRIGTLGKPALVDTDIEFSIFVSLGLIKYKRDIIYGKYLKYFLDSPNAYKQYERIKAVGSHTHKLNLRDIPKILIPLPYKDGKPDLQKQKEIVNKIETLFNNINTAIELRQKAINETKDLFNSVLNKIFKDEGFKWVRLGEIIKTEKGKKPKNLINECSNKTLPYLTVDYYRNGVLKQYSEENDKMKIVKPNDLVLIWDGSKSGEVFISNIEGILASTMVKINIKDVNYDSKYIYWVIKHYFPILNNNTTGSGIPHVSKEVFNNLVVPTPYKDGKPDLQKQNEIAEYLENLHNKIKRLENLQEKQLNLLKELKESILNKAFKGELV